MTDFADGCPECVPVDPALPHRVWASDDLRSGVRADYRCKVCGHQWYTTWLVTAAEMTGQVAREGAA